MLKKILYIHHAGNFSGAARSLSYLIENLDRSKYAPELLVIQKGTSIDFFRKLNIKIHVDDSLYPFHGTTVSGMSLKRFLTNWLGFFLTIIRFPKILRKINPEIIHLNTTCLFTFAFVAKKGRKKIKIISHVREPLLPSFHGSTLRYFNEKYVDKLIPISNFDGARFKNKRKLKVIYNFVDTNVYKPKTLVKNDFKTLLGIDTQSIIFLYLSRVAPTNGALEFVKAASEISSDEPNISFILAGFNPKDDSEYNRRIKKISSSSKSILLLEMTTNVVELISECDIIVSPFTVPHFSRSVIEGAAMGKPAIISNVGSQNELVKDGDTGLVFELSDFQSFKNAIVILSRDKRLREEMGLNSRSLALEKFSSTKNVKETFSLYEN